MCKGQDAIEKPFSDAFTQEKSGNLRVMNSKR